MTPSLGPAGRLAAAFIHSKLTPLIVVVSLLLGAYAVVALPREEEPQIKVPMIDVFVELPGASPTEIEQRVTRPLEQSLREIPGVEYVYSTSSSGRSMIVVRFLVGEDEEQALVRLNQKLAANAPALPPGASAPLVQLRTIDDVPVMSLTLWGKGYDDVRLRAIARQLQEVLKELPDVSTVTVIGGRPRQITVDLDPAALAARHVDPLAIQQALAAGNDRTPAGDMVAANRSWHLESGRWLESVQNIRSSVIATSGGGPVRLADVATVTDGAGEPSSYVMQYPRPGEAFPAVTLSIAKRKGTNAIGLTQAVEHKVAGVRGYLLPSDLQTSVTRNYGDTAAQKSNELLWHMFLAVVSVSALIWVFLGRRESAVVLIAIPVTLALTLFVFYLYGYTLNRITLFALIFSIGILVDDAIVVVENIVRHMRLTRNAQTLETTAVRAVDEVGNPTILATLTVVAAILPMAFVGGLMGPYMRPIPVGASAAMLFSLLVAFVVTPWAAVRLLSRSCGDHEQPEDRLTALYRRVMALLTGNPLPARRLSRSRRDSPARRGSARADRTRHCQDAAVRQQERAASRRAHAGRHPARDHRWRGIRACGRSLARTTPSPAYQSYTGTASPYTFNGLVRHYFLRQAPNLADLQVMLVGKDERREQSHTIAKRLRARLDPIASRLGARIQVVEVPPGPPVLQTIVAEIYGPDPDLRLEVAKTVRATFEQTSGVVDVDWYVESSQPKIRLDVDQDKAAAAGVSAAQIAAVVRMAGAGTVSRSAARCQGT